VTPHYVDISKPCNLTAASCTTAVSGDVAFNTNKFTVTAASGNTTVAGTLSSTGDFKVNTNKFTVTATNGNTLVAGTLDVTGATALASTLGVTGDVAVNTNKFNVTAASGNTVIAGTLDVTGATALSSTLGVTGDFAVNTNKFTVAAASGNTLVAGTLSSTGDFAINTNKFTVAAASGNTLVAGTLSSTGNFAINTNKFNVTAASGNTAIAGTLDVTGLITGSGGSTVPTGQTVTLQGSTSLSVGGTSSFGADIKQTAGKQTYRAPAVNSFSLAATDQTLSVTDLLTNRIVQVTTGDAANKLVTPTAAQIVAALPTPAVVGDTFTFLVSNADAASALITGGADVTFGPATVTIAAGGSRVFYCRATNVGGGTEAVTCY
jgi:hypothetical protein